MSDTQTLRRDRGRRANAWAMTLFTVIAMGLFVPMERAHAANENRFAGQGVNDPAFVIAWTNVGNILSDNNSDANSAGGFDSDEIHSYLRSRNYGFTIPAGATILGIEVQVEIWDANATLDMDDDNARLVKADVLVGADRAMAAVWPSSRTVRTYGSPTDLWGTTWTPAEVNAAGFGFAHQPNARSGGTNAIARADYHRIIVYYALVGTYYWQQDSGTSVAGFTTDTTPCGAQYRDEYRFTLMVTGGFNCSNIRHEGSDPTPQNLWLMIKDTPYAGPYTVTGIDFALNFEDDSSGGVTARYELGYATGGVFTSFGFADEGPHTSQSTYVTDLSAISGVAPAGSYLALRILDVAPSSGDMRMNTGSSTGGGILNVSEVPGGASVCPSGGTVSTTVDSVTGDSLRACIIWANGNAGVDTLTVPAGTYTLTIAGTGEDAAATGDLDITDGIIINGNAAGATIIDANGIDRVFEVFGVSATMTNVTVSNGNVTGFGGGIHADPTSSLTLSSSTFSGNTSTTDGGGVYAGNTADITNVTFSANAADRGGGFGCNWICTLTNVTVNVNTATDKGGGIFQGGGGGSSITFLNTIVANNTASTDPDCSGPVARLISNGHNLSSDATCNFTAGFDQQNTDPLLGPLQDNGGPTFTHDLLAGSTAIEGGDNTGCPATDQRGTARPVGVFCDIGAVEATAAAVCPSGGTVSTTVDSVTGDSLRACIIWANGNAGVDTLTVPAGTYTLTLTGTGENAAATGDLDITDGIIINGNAAAATIIDGNAIDRVFDILGANLTATNLTIRDGDAQGSDDGGGIAIDATGSLTLSRSTVSGNSSDDEGGGIFSSDNGTITLENVTISGNTADDDGGGLHCRGPCDLTNVTITGNSVSGSGDGVREEDSGNVTFLNTIVANNGPGGDNCSGSFVSNGNNLSSDATCDFTAGGDQQNTDPLLGVLQNNGGPTDTHALGAGSLAIDGGTDTGCPATDQRGTGRPIGGSCDIGAYEAAAQAVCPGAVVTNTIDAATGGSLRACIIWANGNAGADSISFSIPGGGPHTIRPTSAYPNITDTVTIDGTTEPDFVSDPIVELDGVFAGASARGLWINGSGDGSTIRGLVINSYDSRGIQVNDPNVTIVGNWIGLDTDGVTAAANDSQGIFFTNSGDNATVGGTVDADRNVISGNTSQGIAVRGNNVVISGNYIGTDSTGTVLVGNGSHGVRIRNDADDNMVGGTTAAHANIIAGNSGDGITHDSTGTANSFLRNLIYGNSGIGIDLTNDGVTENDAGDVDPAIPPAANNLLNFPVITAASESGGTLDVDFDLDVIPAGNYRIEFFTNPSGADGSGNGEGEIFQDAVTIAHGGTGVESFSHSFAGAAGDILTVTATLDLGGSNYGETSEFGDAFTATTGAATLLGRYCVNETASGTGPPSILDDQASPLNLSITYDAPVAWFTHASGNRGLNAASDPHVGVAVAAANGTKYATNLDGATQATFALVADVLPAADTQRLAGFFRSGDTRVAYIMADGSGRIEVRFRMQGGVQNAVRWPTSWEDGVRRVFHVVYDSDDPTDTSRIRLYVNGIDQGIGTLTQGLWPTPGAALDFSFADLELAILNEPLLTKPQHGTVYHYAVYDGELTNPEISTDATALLIDDDCGGGPAAAADLALTKTDSADPVPVSTPFTYTLTATNNGPNDANNVTLVDTLPADVAYQNATPSQGSCVHSGEPLGGTVTCSLGTILNAANATVDIDIDSPIIVGPINNTAVVSADEVDPVPADNTANEPTTIVVNEADLRVTKVDDVDPNGVGLPIVYTVTITNQGPGAATGVTLVDTLDAATTYVSAVPTQGICGEAAGVVTCTIGALANGISASVVITATAPGTPQTVTNTAVVSGVEPDFELSDNTVLEDTTITNPPPTDLQLTKTDSPDPVVEGNTLTYTLTVTNLGPGPATNVLVVDTLPAGVTFISAVPSTGSCNPPSPTVDCDLNTLSNGDVETIVIVVTAPLGAGVITNNAVVSTNRVDPVAANNSASADTTVTVPGGADVSLSKSDSPDPVNVAQTLSYTLTVDNLGPDDATDVTAVDTLPATVAYQSVVPSQGSCIHSGEPFGGTVTCTFGTIANAANASANIFVTAPVSAGSITNNASVSTSAADGNPANDTASEDTDVVNLNINQLCYLVADAGGGGGGNDLLTRIDTADFDPVTNETNIGIGTGTNSIEAIAWNSATSVLYGADAGQLGILNTTTGVFAALPSPFGTGDGALGAITFTDVDGLAYDATTGILFGVEVQGGTDVLIQINMATGAHVPDAFGAGIDYVPLPPVLGNSITDDIAVDPLTGVMYAAVNAGGSTDRLININKVTGATTDIALITVPDIEGLGTDVTGQLWGTSGTQGILYELSKTTGVGSNGRTIDNGSDYEAVDCDQFSPSVSADLAVTKGVDDPTPTEGDTISYTVNVTNNGPSTASVIQLSDVLPAGVTYVSDTPTQGSYDSGTGNWFVGTLTVSSTATLTIQATVDLGTGGSTITNTASVTFLIQNDPNPSNDSDSVDINPVADLIIIKRSFEADGTVIPTGSVVPNYLEFKYLLYINNKGGAVSDVSVRDIFAAAFQYQTGTIQVDNSVAECVLVACTPAEELAIFTAVDGAGPITDAVDGDAASFAGSTLDAGNQYVGNPQLNINANAVWAILFSVKMP